MSVTHPVSSPYLEEIALELATSTNFEIAERITAATARHDAWRATCANLLSSDNVMSRKARRLLDSDLATRVSEGLPGARDYPTQPLNTYADELEAILIALARNLYRAPYIEWRPLSICLANGLAIWALTGPGDRMMVQADEGGGGNFGYQAAGLPSVRGLETTSMPMDDLFNIDLERLRSTARQTRPKLLVIGGSSVLFPYPLMELRTLADEVNAKIVYDAAHVGLLMATGMFQDALAEGADVVTVGTNKIASGPLGAFVLTRDRDIAKRVMALTYPGLIQARDQNKFAAAALAMAEMSEFGHAYADQAVRNARALGAALAEHGLTVLAADRGFTMTHQVFVDMRAYDVWEANRRLVEAGVLTHPAQLPMAADGQPRGGMRLSVQEVTRRGMTERDMSSIASWFGRLVLEHENSARVRKEVREVMGSFGRVCFSFDDTDADANA
jgi:glycine hydroxymethyltransferase